MLMNKLEFILMNNPIRRFIQSSIEVKRMKKLSQLKSCAPLVLEIGCGSGYGTKLIKKKFQPQKIEAIDLDEEMIKLARQRNNDPSISFHVGDAAALKYKDNTFDAIFDFETINHIPNWRNCLVELKRVLKSDGELIVEDISIDTFKTPLGRFLRWILKHPYESMYTRSEFFNYVNKLGFKKIKKANYHTGGIHYFILTAIK